jgi:hypothetical protein
VRSSRSDKHSKRVQAARTLWRKERSVLRHNAQAALRSGGSTAPKFELPPAVFPNTAIWIFTPAAISQNRPVRRRVFYYPHFIFTDTCLIN